MDSIQLRYSEPKEIFIFSSKIDIQDVIDNKPTSDEFLTFFAELINIKRTNMIPDIEKNPEFLDDSGEPNDNKNTKQLKSAHLKNSKIKPLFQIMRYCIHYRRQSTPFHIADTSAIYEKYKSKVIITQQNRLGLSVSYNTIKIYCTKLAKCSINFSKSNFMVC